MYSDWTKAELIEEIRGLELQIEELENENEELNDEIQKLNDYINKLTNDRQKLLHKVIDLTFKIDSLYHDDIATLQIALEERKEF